MSKMSFCALFFSNIDILHINIGIMYYLKDLGLDICTIYFNYSNTIKIYL